MTRFKDCGSDESASTSCMSHLSMEANLSNNPNDSTEPEPHVHARFQSHCVRGYVYCTGCQDFQTAGVVARFGVARCLLHPPRYIVLPPCPPQPGLLRGNIRPTQIDSTFNPSFINWTQRVQWSLRENPSRVLAKFSPCRRGRFSAWQNQGCATVELLRNPHIDIHHAHSRLFLSFRS